MGSAGGGGDAALIEAELAGDELKVGLGDSGIDARSITDERVVRQCPLGTSPVSAGPGACYRVAKK